MVTPNRMKDQDATLRRVDRRAVAAEKEAEHRAVEMQSFPCACSHDGTLKPHHSAYYGKIYRILA
ncbi:hypothetical protein [Mesorhizobium sp.]|uniref:hypothetical protein n=1 Tax=Mesorhizobium sp. TaxID=1871066 RepID=UPI002579DC72|nr:hypothetical protein [Mesorhizobium sp.]